MEIDPKLADFIAAISDPAQRIGLAEKLAQQFGPPAPGAVEEQMGQQAGPQIPPVPSAPSSLSPNARPKDFQTQTLNGQPGSVESVPLARSSNPTRPPDSNPKKASGNGEVGPKNPTSPGGLPGPAFTKPLRGSPVKGLIAKKEPIRSKVFEGLK